MPREKEIVSLVIHINASKIILSAGILTSALQKLLNTLHLLV